MTIERSDLKVGRTPLGRGSTATVYPLSGDPTMVLKEYHPRLLPEINRRSLEGVIALREALPPDTRETFDRLFCWPRELVTNKGRLTGVRLHRIPRHFTFSQNRRVVNRTLDHLWFPERTLNVGLKSIDRGQSLAIIYALGRALALTEKLGIVHGDICEHHVLQTIQNGRPLIYIIDCDGVAVDGSPPAIRVFGSRLWLDPRVAARTVSAPDAASVSYAFSLALLRAWNQTPAIVRSSSRPRLDPPANTPLDDLVTAGLGQNGGRPSVLQMSQAIGSYLQSHPELRGPELVAFVDSTTPDIGASMNAPTTPAPPAARTTPSNRTQPAPGIPKPVALPSRARRRRRQPAEIVSPSFAAPPAARAPVGRVPPARPLHPTLQQLDPSTLRANPGIPAPPAATHRPTPRSTSKGQAARFGSAGQVTPGVQAASALPPIPAPPPPPPEHSPTSTFRVATAAIIIGLIVAALVILMMGRAAHPDYRSLIQGLHDDCQTGDLEACDYLYLVAIPGTPDRQFGNTCGERTHGGTWCSQTTLAVTANAYGDDATLDALWDSCAADDMSACDELYRQAPPGSVYQEFGDTCGGITNGGTWCAETANSTGTAQPAATCALPNRASACSLPASLA